MLHYGCAEMIKIRSDYLEVREKKALASWRHGPVSLRVAAAARKALKQSHNPPDFGCDETVLESVVKRGRHKAIGDPGSHDLTP